MLSHAYIIFCAENLLLCLKVKVLIVCQVLLLHKAVHVCPKLTQNYLYNSKKFNALNEASNSTSFESEIGAVGKDKLACEFAEYEKELRYTKIYRSGGVYT